MIEHCPLTNECACLASCQQQPIADKPSRQGRIKCKGAQSQKKNLGKTFLRLSGACVPLLCWLWSSSSSSCAIPPPPPPPYNTNNCRLLSYSIDQHTYIANSVCLTSQYLCLYDFSLPAAFRLSTLARKHKRSHHEYVSSMLLSYRFRL